MSDTFEIGTQVVILGINLGNCFGNLKDGLSIKVNLLAESGTVKFYLKNGCEVWIQAALTGMTGINLEHKVASF
jgi:hypothetical protein